MQIENPVLKILKKASEYKHAEGKKISASELGSDLLQIYLRIIDDREPTDDDVGQNTIGSVFHKGMEATVREMLDHRLQPEVEVEKEYPDGWRMTGTIDLVHQTPDFIEVHDYKLTKIYKGKMLKKDFKKFIAEDPYAIQINAYGYMLDQSLYRSKNIKCILDMFYKDANPLKAESSYEPIEVPYISGAEIDRIFIEKATELDKYLNSDSVPTKCSDVWTRKVNGNVIDTKCELYCSVKDICPYFNDRGKSTLEKTGWGL